MYLWNLQLQSFLCQLSESAGWKTKHRTKSTKSQGSFGKKSPMIFVGILWCWSIFVFSNWFGWLFLIGFPMQIIWEILCKGKSYHHHHHHHHHHQPPISISIWDRLGGWNFSIQILELNWKTWVRVLELVGTRKRFRLKKILFGDLQQLNHTWQKGTSNKGGL